MTRSDPSFCMSCSFRSGMSHRICRANNKFLYTTWKKLRICHCSSPAASEEKETTTVHKRLTIVYEHNMSVLLIITGASRGLGAAMAVEFVKSLTAASGSSSSSSKPTTSYIRVILIARSMEGLTTTEESILNLEKQKSLPSLCSIDITKHDIDLANMSTLENEINTLFRMEEKFQHAKKKYDRVIFINNAGNLGHLGPSTTTDLQQLRQTLDFNVTSSLWLTTRFLQEMQTKQEQYQAEEESPTATTTWDNVVVVNISSLCAIEPFPTMAAYCAGKAARNMFYQTLAKEYGATKDNHVKFLNYAPGPCDTEMTTELSTCDNLDAGLKSFFRTSSEKGTFVQPHDTSKELVRLVLQNDFESGIHIDYYDVLNHKTSNKDNDDDDNAAKTAEN